MTWFGSSFDVVRARREMLGQHAAAERDRLDEAVGEPALAGGDDERADGIVPDARLDLAIDTLVGDDLDLALGQRHEDEHARALARALHAAGQELVDGRAVHPVRA